MHADNVYQTRSSSSNTAAPFMMEAAQMQAAELRALHSAVLNKYSLFNVSDHQNINGLHQLPQQYNMVKSRRPAGSTKKPKQHRTSHDKARSADEEDAFVDADGPRSSSSAASSTADCFIRPAYEYPVFMPTHREDLLLSQMEGAQDYQISGMEDRRSSVDRMIASAACDVDALMMRKERLNYIFDHDNKRNFSGSKYNMQRYRDEQYYNPSCLHESLNLPPRTTLTSNPLYHEYSSLNLHQGSHGHLSDSTDKLINPTASLSYSDNADHYQSPTSSFKGLHINDPDLRHVAETIRANNVTQHEQHGKAPPHFFTGRQKALLEFLSEEPARMRAFNELAAMEAAPASAPSSSHYTSQHKQRHQSLMSRAPPSKVAMLNHPNEDIAERPESMVAAGSGRGNQIVGDPYTASENADTMESLIRMNSLAGDHELYTASKTGDGSHGINDESSDHNPASLMKTRQNSSHSAHAMSQENSSHGAGPVSCDKCRPIREGHAASCVVPVSDTKDLNSCAKHKYGPSYIAAASASSATATDRPDQKKPSSFKDWLFRGRKKHKNEVGHASSSGTSNKDQTNHASTFSAPTAATTSSRVFSGLANAETEKELEVAMAMDLMELKVLQANSKRDAAMAEVLELRLAIESMAKKLAKVERHCFNLESQLEDVQAMQRQSDTAADDGTNVIVRTAIMKAPANEVIVTDHKVRSTSTSDVEAHVYSPDDMQERRLKPNVDRGIGNSGYAGWSASRRMPPSTQPTKAEFLNAVAEARVGVKQLCRVLLQHIQESKPSLISVPAKKDGISEVEVVVGGEGGAGDAAMTDAGAATMLKLHEGSEADHHHHHHHAENWGPILMMFREVNSDNVKVKGAALSLSRGLSYCVESLVNMAFYEHFENVGFDKSGTHRVLEPGQRAMAFYHAFLKLAKLTCTQLLTQPSPLYNAAFDRFCARKIRALGRALGCPGRLWPDEVARTFLAAARAIWLLHHLAFSFPATPGNAVLPPGIFRVAAHSPLDSRFMEVLATDHRHVEVVPSGRSFTVSLMVMPGFFLVEDVIKCKVLASSSS